MKQPSRFMPEYPLRRPGVVGWLVALAYVVLFVWLIAEGLLKNPWAVLIGVAAVLMVVVSVRHGRARAAALRDLAMRREGQSICDFARDFDARDVDTRVIRAVYEQLQQYLNPTVEQFPVRADDELLGKLIYDPDDLDMDLAVQIAARTGRSLKRPQDNPHYQHICTVRDFVCFFNAQPLTTAPTP
jgi:hypothetical protein